MSAMDTTSKHAPTGGEQPATDPGTGHAEQPAQAPSIWRSLSLVFAFDLIALLFFLDQLSKWYVLEVLLRPLGEAAAQPSLSFLDWIAAINLPRLPFAGVTIWPVLNIALAWNEGISFSMLSGNAALPPIVMIALLSTVVLGFGVWMIRTNDLSLRFVLAMVVGGALGNLWDRVRFGAVADFIDLHIGTWHYATFNVADACIVLGVAGLALNQLIYRHKRDGNI